MIEALAVVQNVWAALSLVSAVVSVTGLALIAAGVLVLPGPFRRAAVALGVVLLVGSSFTQASHVAGARSAQELATKRDAEAELERAKLSAEISRADVERKERDLARTQSDYRKLKGLLDDIRKSGDACVDRDVARRLREL